MKINIKRMVRKNFRGASLLMAAAFLFISNAAMIVANPDFTGSWTLNESKSELGQFGARMASKTLTITADAGGLSVTKSLTGMNGEATPTVDKMTLDGKEFETTFFGTNKKKSTAKWSDDGQSLIIASTMAFEGGGQSMQFKSAETWKMVDGMLQITTTTSGSNFPETTTKMTYEKAK